MKKLFVAVLAVAALASCAQEDVILNNDKAITFGDAYVQNSTKAIYEDSEEVDAFQVWGTVTGTDGTVALYNGANVTRPDGKAYGDAWTCDVTRFWTPNCDYAFYAVVDAAAGAVTADNGVPTSIAYTADGTTDLLYGATEKTTKDPDNAAGLAEPTPALVAFTMEHLLSRIQFTLSSNAAVKDGDKAAYTLNVTELKITNAWGAGEYTIANETWTRTGSNTVSLDFGTASSIVSGTPVIAGTPNVIIPSESGAKTTLTVSYKYEVLFDNDTTQGDPAKVIYATSEAVTKTLEHTFVKGTAYNINAALTIGNEIEFTIETVDGFDPAGGDVTIQ